MTTLNHILIVLAVLCTFAGYPQATGQPLSLEACDELFLKNNLLLLAQQYQIDARQALVIQAKAYPNPTFNADFNVYDPQNNKFFHVDSTGQKAFQVEQLILLGGKRRTAIEIARQNRSLAEAEFSELLRNLRSGLHACFYNLNSGKLIIDNYNRQLQVLDTIIREYRVQADKGNLPLKDVIRLKSVYIRLNATRSEMAAQYNEDQKRLRLLLRTKDEIIPIVQEDDFRKYTSLKPLDELKDLALANRPDLKMADDNAVLAALNLELQKKQLIPDIAINASYDQRGGAFNNQLNAGITLPLPILNTNRGNRKAAELDRKTMDTYLEEKKLEVELDAEQAWLDMQRSINEYNKVREMYNEEFTQVNKGMTTNFQLRNISILEFVDFVEAYNASLLDFEQVKKQLAQAAGRINYVTAVKLY